MTLLLQGSTPLMQGCCRAKLSTSAEADTVAVAQGQQEERPPALVTFAAAEALMQEDPRFTRAPHHERCLGSALAAFSSTGKHVLMRPWLLSLHGSSPSAWGERCWRPALLARSTTVEGTGQMLRNHIVIRPEQDETQVSVISCVRASTSMV